jgi:flagellar biosynthesis protein FlhG
VSSLNGYFDYMIIDTAPGIDSNVLYLNSAVHEILVVVTPEPSSLTDAYALIKVLNKYHKEEKFSIICNEVQSETDALFIYKRLSEVTERFLCVSLDYKGFIPNDPSVTKANRRQELVLDVSPYAPAAKALQEIAEQIQKGPNVERFKGGLQFFWEQVLGVA